MSTVYLNRRVFLMNISDIVSGNPITEDTTVEKLKEYQSAGTKRKTAQSIKSNKGKKAN